MRNFLAFLAAAVIVLAGAGWYLDWFKFSTKPEGDGHQKVLLDVDTSKMGSDVSKGETAVKQMIDKDKSSEPKPDGKGVEVKADNKGVEITTPKIDVALPVKP
jgi:hypothetical protein